MNIDYLYSIINLYLKKEINNKRTILSIKRLDDMVEFSFSMKQDNEDKTTFVSPACTGFSSSISDSSQSNTLQILEITIRLLSSVNSPPVVFMSSIISAPS